MQHTRNSGSSERPRWKKNQLSKAVQDALRTSAAIALLSSANVVAAQDSTSSILELSDLDGSNGFAMNGVSAVDLLGLSISGAGDINGDGVDDLIVSAPGVDPFGASYVVFGDGDVGGAGVIDPGSLSGADGFAITVGEAFNSIQVSAAGDINDDGLDDLIIGAPYAQGGGTEFDLAGEAYVVFGARNLGSDGAIAVSSLDGTNGFVLNGEDPWDFFGSAVSGAGDFNGDGVDDLIIGAYGDYSRSVVQGAGRVYVIFGGQDVGSEGVLDMSRLAGNEGFRINGINPQDGAGRSVSSTGDVNGDGFDDVIIGAINEYTSTNDGAGQSFVIFGGSEVGSSGMLDLSSLDGPDGFVINGIDGYDYAGFSVSGAGDINGDGMDDMIVGAPFAGSRDANGTLQGESYVLFGGSGVGGSGIVNLATLNAPEGFVIVGSGVAGHSVSGTGDISGDGIDDVIIGAPGSSTNSIRSSGSSYVLFGGSSVGASGLIKLTSLSSADGIVINGSNASDGSGRSVSGVGDINNDGVNDVAIGAGRANVNGNRLAGRSFVVFGGSDLGNAVPQCNGFTPTVNLGLGQSPTAGDDIIIGTPGGDVILGGSGNDAICGLGGNDLIRGERGDDFLDGGDGEDDLLGGVGDDWLEGGDSEDELRGGLGDDTLFGDNGDDILKGNSGVDILIGGVGADTLRGGSGNDDLRGGSGADTLFGDSGDDLVNGGQGADTLSGGAGNDNLQGGASSDLVRGGAGDDVVLGGAGDDVLEGGLDSDSLSGGSGNDQCDGGGGSADTTRSSCESVTNVP